MGRVHKKRYFKLVLILITGDLDIIFITLTFFCGDVYLYKNLFSYLITRTIFLHTYRNLELEVAGRMGYIGGKGEMGKNRGRSEGGRTTQLGALGLPYCGVHIHPQQPPPLCTPLTYPHPSITHGGPWYFPMGKLRGLTWKNMLIYE